MLASQGPSNAQKSPGAMTMAMRTAPSPVGVKRALRVGVVRGGKIIDERIFRTPGTVRVGSAEANDLMLDHSSGVPRFALFERAGDRLFLRFSPEMQGRVGGAAGLASLDELRTSGRASAYQGVHRLRLDEHSRGKLVIGETTLLFQMVVPPPITPKPALPASARGGFVAAIDWLFTACVVCAYAGFFGGIVYLENADWPLASAMQNLSPDAVAEMIFSEPEPPPEPSVDRTPEPTTEPVATPTPEPMPERHARRTPRPHTSP
ncbi:MAG: hypothetical protein GXP55_00670, partial [Deltaproteobacteria bacterium]|nr:hypothetical protein [Deltaproteobacteria bacterium]